eukprot:gene9181-11255_t
MNKFNKIFRKSVQLPSPQNNSGTTSSSSSSSSYQPITPSNSSPTLISPSGAEGDEVKVYFLVHSILSKKGPSSGNLLHGHHHNQKSWQPFFKKNSFPSFLIICKKTLIILDASTHPFVLHRRISLMEIKEVLFDTSEIGLFSIELSSNQPQRIDPSLQSILYFSVGVEKRDLQDQIMSSMEDILKEYFINEHKTGAVTIKKCNMLGDVDQQHKNSIKNHINELLDEMSLMGISAQDLWEGNIDLKYWVDKIKDFIVLNNDERYVVEFVLPDSAYDTSGMCKKIFRVPNNVTIREITHFLCSRIQIQDSSKYTLATIKGTEVNENDILADYGLGSFFDNWQLFLVEKGKVTRGGTFDLEVHFPDSSEFQGRHHRILSLDAYMPSSKIVKYIGSQMDIPKSHLYAIKLEIPLSSMTSSTSVTGGSTATTSSTATSTTPAPATVSTTTTAPQTQPGYIVLEDDEYLSTHGLGSKFRKCKLKLVPKKFPKASFDKQKNLNVVKSILDDMVQDSWKEYYERKNLLKYMKCKEIVDFVVETAVLECIRASTLSVRLASLGIVGRTAMYKLLAQKEQEEINYYKMAGQKKVSDDAKDLIYNLTPLMGPSSNVNIDVESVDPNAPKMRSAPPAPPPPPPPGFKGTKLKSTSTSTTTAPKMDVQKLINTGVSTNIVDMNQILGMRGKLRSTKREEIDPNTEDKNEKKALANFTLRNVKSLKQEPSVVVATETNELMLKLQKRHALANGNEAEELGDS